MRGERTSSQRSRRVWTDSGGVSVPAVDVHGLTSVEQLHSVVSSVGQAAGGLLAFTAVEGIAPGEGVGVFSVIRLHRVRELLREQGTVPAG